MDYWLRKTFDWDLMLSIGWLLNEHRSEEWEFEVDLGWKRLGFMQTKLLTFSTSPEYSTISSEV